MQRAHAYTVNGNKKDLNLSFYTCKFDALFERVL